MNNSENKIDSHNELMTGIVEYMKTVREPYLFDKIEKLNFNKIYELFPKASKLFIKFFLPGITGITKYEFDKAVDNLKSLRDLYDFFDENNVYIHISIHSMLGNADSNVKAHNFYFSYYILNKEHTWIVNNDIKNPYAIKTRKDLEPSAFYHAFKVLESINS
jgi:hypothetical protein